MTPRSPRWTVDEGLSWPLSTSLAYLFGEASALRSRLYQHGVLRSHRLPVVVISVGNLIAGGAGKTPLVIALATHLLDCGRRVAVLHRGYRARAERGLHAIAPGEGPRADARLFGDEAVLVARREPRAAVLAGADRVCLGQRAIDQFAVDTLVLDDGFQHRRLARDLDLLVLRAPRLFGNGRCLPAGPLREPVEAALRADLWVINETDVDETNEPFHLSGFGSNGDRPCVRFRAVVEHVVDAGSGQVHSAQVLRGQRLLLATGVARPASVKRSVEILGGRVVDQINKADHHPWSAQELAALWRRARQADMQVVTTEKDVVKWREIGHPTWVLRQEIRWLSGKTLLDERLHALFA